MSLSELTDPRTTTSVTVGRVDEIPLGEGRAFVAGGTQIASTNGANPIRVYPVREEDGVVVVEVEDFRRRKSHRCSGAVGTERS
jgi:hypothetical protein